MQCKWKELSLNLVNKIRAILHASIISLKQITSESWLQTTTIYRDLVLGSIRWLLWPHCHGCLTCPAVRHWAAGLYWSWAGSQLKGQGADHAFLVLQQWCLLSSHWQSLVEGSRALQRFLNRSPQMVKGSSSGNP